jgi:hypothetical protein
MKIFNFARLLPKVIFENNEKQKMIWVIKNIFSLHWQWNKDETAIIETIENIGLGKEEGVILVTSNSEDTDLLIIIGLYLRHYMRRLSLHKFSPGK